MRKTLFIALFALCSLCTWGQVRKLFPVDWHVIEQTTAQYPDSVKSLIKRLSAPTLDHTLTFEERRLAIYGQSILTEGKEQLLADLAKKNYREQDYKASIENAQKALEINPLNVTALHVYKSSIAESVKAGDTDYTMDDGQIIHNREMRIYNTIATTGDGSEKYPFYVCTVAEEYCFMRYYLDLWEWSMQELIGQCDVFTLTEASEYYAAETIYFDTSRSLTILHKMIGK